VCFSRKPPVPDDFIFVTIDDNSGFIKSWKH
jgi:hypothetical protein